MNRKTACEVYRRLLARYPIVDGRRHFIEFHNPFEALILTILSAQTTDRAVNAIRDELFSRYPTPAALASAEPEEVEPLIRSIGFHHMKTRYIVGAARKIVSGFGGEVPQTMEELLSLPGVGRKTANDLGSPRARTPRSSNAISWHSFHRRSGKISTSS